MKRPPQYRKRDRGITLVEIIVCTVILTILAALLLGVIGRFRKSAAQASDAANLRGLWMVCERFSQDNGNYLIMGMDRRNFFGQNPREDKWMSWMYLLEPYYETSPIEGQRRKLISPGDPSRGGAERLGSNSIHRSYGINSRTEWGERPLNRFIIRKPSIFVIMANYDINSAGDSANINGGLSGGKNSLHHIPRDWFGNGTANFLFLDGHIEAINVDDVQPDGARYYLFNRDLNRPENRDHPKSGF